MIQIQIRSRCKICREMHGIAEYVEIKCANDQLMFTCKGDYAERETVLRESEDGINVIKKKKKK